MQEKFSLMPRKIALINKKTVEMSEKFYDLAPFI